MKDLTEADTYDVLVLHITVLVLHILLLIEIVLKTLFRMSMKLFIIPQD